MPYHTNRFQPYHKTWTRDHYQSLIVWKDIEKESVLPIFSDRSLERPTSGCYRLTWGCVRMQSQVSSREWSNNSQRCKRLWSFIVQYTFLSFINLNYESCVILHKALLWSAGGLALVVNLHHIFIKVKTVCKQLKDHDRTKIFHKRTKKIWEDRLLTLVKVEVTQLKLP